MRQINSGMFIFIAPYLRVRHAECEHNIINSFDLTINTWKLPETCVANQLAAMFELLSNRLTDDNTQ